MEIGDKLQLEGRFQIYLMRNSGTRIYLVYNPSLGQQTTSLTAAATQQRPTYVVYTSVGSLSPTLIPTYQLHTPAHHRIWLPVGTERTTIPKVVRCFSSATSCTPEQYHLDEGQANKKLNTA